MLTSTKSKVAPFVEVPDGITLAHAIVDTVRDPLLVLDENLRIVAASRAFHQTFHLVDEDVRGHLIYEIDDGQWNIPELRTLLETIAKDHETVEGYEVDREFPRVGRRIMLLNARKVFYAEGTHTTTLLAFEDVTHRRAVEQQVQELLLEKDMLLQEMQHRVANSLQLLPAFFLSRRGPSSRRKRDCNWRMRISASCRLPPFNSTWMSPVVAGQLRLAIIFRNYAKHWRSR
jgi:PAS domain S-box-containing protein